jgi:hypothetical protein
MLTVQLAWELRDTSIKLNSADPAAIIRLVLLPDEDPTGTFPIAPGVGPW